MLQALASLRLLCDAPLVHVSEAEMSGLVPHTAHVTAMIKASLHAPPSGETHAHVHAALTAMQAMHWLCPHAAALASAPAARLHGTAPEPWPLGRDMRRQPAAGQLVTHCQQMLLGRVEELLACLFQVRLV